MPIRDSLRGMLNNQEETLLNSFLSDESLTCHELDQVKESIRKLINVSEQEGTRVVEDRLAEEYNRLRLTLNTGGLTLSEQRRLQDRLAQLERDIRSLRARNELQRVSSYYNEREWGVTTGASVLDD